MLNFGKIWNKTRDKIIFGREILEILARLKSVSFLHNARLKLSDILHIMT